MGSQRGFNILLLQMKIRIFLPIGTFLLAMILKAYDIHLTRGIAVYQGISSKQGVVNPLVSDMYVAGTNITLGMNPQSASAKDMGNLTEKYFYRWDTRQCGHVRECHWL